jgi:hypothetical protein
VQLRNLTPEHMRCGLGQCPAVFELPDGSLVIIGRNPDTALASLLADKVGQDEQIVVISPALLADLRHSGSTAAEGAEG